MVEDERRPTLRSYDEFETKKRRKRSAQGQTEGALPGKRQVSPDKLTCEALREAALRYLDKQDASVDQLRRVLERRIVRYGDEASRPSALRAIEEILARLKASRVLDDDRFARGLAESQRRRGASLPKVRQKLRARGLGEEEMAAALESLSDNEDLSDDASAQIYARKRRLRERYDLKDPKQREKALASLARQGFSFDVARRALGL